MGYDLRITRNHYWSENEDNPITPAEWLFLIESDSELTLFTENGQYFATWKNEQAWFDWYDGDIYTKNPDELTIVKMLEMAVKLNAKVQGDDGEIYGLDQDGNLMTTS